MKKLAIRAASKFENKEARIDLERYVMDVMRFPGRPLILDGD